MAPCSEVGPVFRAIARNKIAFTLVVLEVAFGFAVISSIVWVGSWYHQRGSVNTGHSTRGLYSVHSVGPAEPLDRARARHERELAALSSAAGIKTAAALSNDIIDPRWVTGFFVRTARHPVGRDKFTAWVIDGSAKLKDTLELKLLAGRPTQWQANEQNNEVLISQTLARELFGKLSAVGERIFISDEATAFLVAGVFADAHLLIPYFSNSDAVVLRARPSGDERGCRYVVRSHAPEHNDQTASMLADSLRKLDPARTVVVRPYKLEKVRHVNVSGGLLATLGIIAAALAMVALVGNLAITAFLVQQRTRQVGIRRALGATPWDIVHYFMIENGLAVAVGCVLGLAISFAYYFAFGFIFPELHLSAWYFVFTAVLFFIDGMLATLFPALRAARIPPTVASRSL